jgi:hypothetical protein
MQRVSVRFAGRAARFQRQLILAGLAAGALVVCAGLGRASDIPEADAKSLQSKLNSLSFPDAAGLAKALGLQAASDSPPDGSIQNYLQDLGPLGGGNVPNYLLEWEGTTSSLQAGSQASAPSWSLYLLDWNAGHWRALPLMGGFEPFTFEVLPRIRSGGRLLAVIVLAGATEVPFPAVFRFQSHSAALVWDGRSDESRYEGYDHGRVQFRWVGGVLQMTATGRADPGLLIFPKEGARGFDARTVYKWEGNAFIPIGTEYSTDNDFTLYRFISALHLHDFRTAYSLIDPAKFLNSAKPDRAAFRKMIEDKFPEFLENGIFKAVDSNPGDGTFELELSDKVYVYSPEFSSGSPILLTGLTRRERKREDE